MKGLIVKEPYATMIVRGEKKWEIRKRRTNIRGRILIISGGKVIGSVELVDVIGPFSAEELANYRELHRVSDDVLRRYAGDQKLYAWVLENPIEFEEKREVKLPRGAQVWVNI